MKTKEELLAKVSKVLDDALDIDDLNGSSFSIAGADVTFKFEVSKTKNDRSIYLDKIIISTWMR